MIDTNLGFAGNAQFVAVVISMPMASSGESWRALGGVAERRDVGMLSE